MKKKDKKLQFYVSPRANRIKVNLSEEGDEVNYEHVMHGSDIMVKSNEKGGYESPFCNKSTEPEVEAKILCESSPIKKKRGKSSNAVASTKRIQELLERVQVFNKGKVPPIKYRKQLLLKGKFAKMGAKGGNINLRASQDVISRLG